MAEKWKTFKHRVETVDGGWRATCATPKRAAQIVLEHNSHKALVVLLGAAKCPACNGSGGIPQQIGEAEWEQEQCQWCYEREAALALAEVKK